MSDADKPPGNSEFSMKAVTLQESKPDRSQAQVAELENSINTLLRSASTFPVRYQPSLDMLGSESGRMTLSIVRAKFEKDWDVKAINAKLSEDSARSIYWIISPKKALQPVKVKKDWEDDDDFNFDDLMPKRFRSNTNF